MQGNSVQSRGIVGGWRALALLVGVGAALSGLPGCDGCSEKHAAVDAAPVVLAPVAAPAGMLAEAVLPTPDTTWKAIQGAIGGPLALTAPTLSGLVAATTGALGLSGVVESDSPAYLVVGGGEGLHWAIAFRATEATALAWAGADAGTFVRSAHDEADMKIFEPARPTADGGYVGVPTGNFVVVASSRADLVALGPYAFRTLPTRALPKEPALVHVTHDGAARLAAFAAARWTDEKDELLAKDEEQRKAHGGRAPDHGDPRALVASVDRWVGGWLDGGRDASSGDLSIDVLDGVLTVEVELAPTAGGPSSAAFGSIHPGEMRAIESAPDGALIAVEVRSDAAERTETASAVTKGAEDVLRLSAVERDALGTDLAAWADARGDELLFGFSASPGRTLFLRAAVKDEGKAAKAFDGLVKRVDGAGFRDPIRAALDVESLHSANISASGVGAGTLWTAERRADARGKGPLPDRIGIFSSAQRGELVATVAEDAPSAAATMLGGGKRLGDDPRIHDALGRLRSRAALVAIARPLATSASPRRDAVVFGAGRDGDRAMLRVEATGPLVRELLRRLGSGP